MDSESGRQDAVFAADVIAHVIALDVVEGRTPDQVWLDRYRVALERLESPVRSD